jgi:hypothetical protein
MSETYSPEMHEAMLERNEDANEGFEAVPYEVSRKVLDELGEREASTRVYAVAEFRRFNGGSVKEAGEFVDTHMVSETPYGYPVWDEADNAGKFVGGVGAVESQSTYLRDANGEFTIPTEQFSVLWDDEGSRGGIGGGIKAWHEKGDDGQLTEKVVGYVNF